MNNPGRADGEALARHREKVRGCSLCFPEGGNFPVADVVKPGVRVMLVGQAPGITEVGTRLPFTGPAGKRLDGWLERAGVRRDDIHFSALAKCFPGKAKGGGDKVPSRAMVSNCSRHLAWEFREIEPEVVILVGGMAIRNILGIKTLSEAAGKLYRRGGEDGVVYVPLPHPSGASTWLNAPENRERLEGALESLGELISRGYASGADIEVLEETS